MRLQLAKLNARIAEIAALQHGAVSIDQLHRLGCSQDSVKRRVAAGHLHRVHRGFYAVGHPALSLEGRWLAAVLAVGRGPYEGGNVLEHWGAAVSHRSALSVWNLLSANQAPCDVIIGGNGGRARRVGIRVHRSLSLVPRDVILHRAIPVTTPERTIADLREAISTRRNGALSGRELRRAIRQANVIGLPIGKEEVADRTRSDLERDFLQLCQRHRLPRPEVNVCIGPYLVDFLWRQRRFVVETDSYLYHRGKVTFQDDRSIDLGLRRLGYEVLRLSELQIDEESDRVAEVLTATLARGSLGGNGEMDRGPVPGP